MSESVKVEIAVKEVGRLLHVCWVKRAQLRLVPVHEAQVHDFAILAEAALLSELSQGAGARSCEKVCGTISAVDQTSREHPLLLAANLLHNEHAKRARVSNQAERAALRTSTPEPSMQHPSTSSATFCPTSSTRRHHARER